MSNGEVTIRFNGINMDNCINQGLELTGKAICPHCKLFYTFRIHVSRKNKGDKFTETIVDGKTMTTLVQDNYAVSMEFAIRQGISEVAEVPLKPEDPDMEPCRPCNRCTANCPKLGY